ncbi:MAG: DUF805 domain-containing protein [Pseudomonadota bacterium]
MELFLSMNGRIGRGKFWIGILALMVAAFVLSFLLGMIGLMSVDETGMPAGAGYWIGLLILMAVTIWPSICIYGKRFHDRDKSAWWMLIGLVPIVGGIWLLVECGLLQGTEGPNRFGPDPVAEG